MKWISSNDFALLIEDHFPANDVVVREWCESGFISQEMAKRNPNKPRSHWFINVKYIKRFLKEMLEFTDKEISEVQAKRSINFNLCQVA